MLRGTWESANRCGYGRLVHKRPKKAFFFSLKIQNSKFKIQKKTALKNSRAREGEVHECVLVELLAADGRGRVHSGALEGVDHVHEAWENRRSARRA